MRFYKTFLWFDVLVPLVAYLSSNLEAATLMKNQLFNCGYNLIELLFLSSKNQDALKKILSTFRKIDAINLKGSKRSCVVLPQSEKKIAIIYQNWLETKRANDLSEDMLFLTSDSDKSPKIHCLIYIDNDDLSLLANTLDSFGAQNYSNWHLSVISPFPCPDEMFEEVPQLSWLQIEQQLDLQSLLLKIGVQSDLVSFLEAGDYFEPHALSSCVQYINQNDDRQVVYTDEDRVSSEGFYHSPNFKPNFNLLILNYFLRYNDFF